MHRKIGYFLGPILFGFIILLGNKLITYGFSLQQVQVIALVMWVVIWWASDAVPNAITAILPLIVLPICGITTILDASKFYSNPIIFLFMGGFFIALAMEKHKLHNRIALKLLLLTGINVNGIVLGFIIATAFLSMWISNTAAVLMMMPIAISIIKLLKDSKVPNVKAKDYNNFNTLLLLSLAYASSIGGVATIIGTPPNVIYAGFLKQYTGLEISFAKWMLVGLPFTIIMLVILFFLFTKILFVSKINNIASSKDIIKNEIVKLGVMSKSEKIVAIIFITTAMLWILKSQINPYIFNHNVLSDTNISLIGGIFMFIIPTSLSKDSFILNWSDTHKLPWGILLLFGGGLCLANALELTKVIEMLINKMPLATIGFGVLLLIFIICTMCTTEVMSNVTASLIYLPIAFVMVKQLNINPFYLTIPITIASSCAFWFPIGTPPNAIVFSSNMVSIKDMIKAGVVLSIISIILIFILSYTLIPVIFN